MSLSFILLTIAEVGVGLFLIWGFWNEEKVVAFEDKIFARLGFACRKKHSAKITQFVKKSNISKRSENCI